MRKSIKPPLVVLGVWLCWALPVWGQSWWEDTEWSFISDWETTIDVHTEGTRKSEVTLKPQLEIPLGETTLFRGMFRVRWDGMDELEPGQPDQPEIDPISRRRLLGDHSDGELRLFTLETEFDEWYLKLGKQQVVWGKADGLKILDVVNPQSFREFILDDFEDSRIPLWTATAEITLTDWDWQFLWIPDKTYNELPKSDAEFEFTSPMIIPAAPPGIPVVLEEPERPDRFFEDSDFGFRASTFLEGWDLSINYLYHYYDTPALMRTILLENGMPKVQVTPQYKRTHLLGGAFSNAFGSLALRGELGYSNSRYFFVNDPLDEDGLQKSGEFAYVLGFDWQGFEDSFLSFQWFQSILDDHSEQMGRNHTESDMTVLLRRNFLNKSLIAEALWLQNQNRYDGLLHPKMVYELQDDWKVWGGLDIFYGESEGFYGQFDKKDQVRVGLEWGI